MTGKAGMDGMDWQYVPVCEAKLGRVLDQAILEGGGVVTLLVVIVLVCQSDKFPEGWSALFRGSEWQR